MDRVQARKRNKFVGQQCSGKSGRTVYQNFQELSITKINYLNDIYIIEELIDTLVKNEDAIQRSVTRTTEITPIVSGFKPHILDADVISAFGSTSLLATVSLSPFPRSSI